MFRSTAVRSAARTAIRSNLTPRLATSQIWTAAKRPQQLAVLKPVTIRLESGSSKIVDTINLKEEAKAAVKKIVPNPELVSLKSSVHSLQEEVGVKNTPHDTDMMAGIRSDLKTIKETFSLTDVPAGAYYFGMAGFLPYLGTSLATVYCAAEINASAHAGSGYLISEKSAELLLHILEPLQIGYGATIISFLGAIHWGLEFAKYGGTHGYSRYITGVWTTALAWPTILLPAEYALITQFILFTSLYYTDSRAARKGWAPPWYGVYRFVLTFIVGFAIVVSLIGRGQIADRVTRPHGPAERIRQLRDMQAEESEEEERYKRNNKIAADEAEDEDEDEQGEEDEQDEQDGEDKGGEDEEKEDGQEDKKEDKKDDKKEGKKSN